MVTVAGEYCQPVGDSLKPMPTSALSPQAMDDTAHSSSAVYIGLVNPKTPINVGGIMRASGCYGVDGVFYTGRRYELAARSGPLQYNADTKNAGERIPLTGVASLLAGMDFHPSRHTEYGEFIVDSGLFKYRINIPGRTITAGKEQ